MTTSPPCEDVVAVGKLPTKGKQAIFAEFFGRIAAVEEEQRQIIEYAVPALERLVQACRDNRVSGQILKIRALLYSAWNGQATELNEILCLDWVLKKDLMIVLLAFGCEPRGSTPFFYDAMTDALRGAGIYDWFLAAHNG